MEMKITIGLFESEWRTIDGYVKVSNGIAYVPMLRWKIPEDQFAANELTVGRYVRIGEEVRALTHVNLKFFVGGYVETPLVAVGKLCHL